MELSKMDINFIDRSIRDKENQIRQLRQRISDLERRIEECRRHIQNCEQVINEQKHRKTNLERLKGQFGEALRRFETIREDEIIRFRSLGTHSATSRFAKGHSAGMLDFLKGPKADVYISNSKRTIQKINQGVEAAQSSIRKTMDDINSLNAEIRRFCGEIDRANETIRVLTNEIVVLRQQRRQALAEQTAQ
jgi:peptidoglycan hydrolase CwlO-like protein